MTEGGQNDAGAGGGSPQDAPPDLSDPKVQWEIAAAQTFAKLQGLAGLFAPHFSQDELPRVVEFIMKEQQVYATQVMQTILQDQRVLAFPKLSIACYQVKPGPGGKPVAAGPEFILECPKRPSGTPEDVLRWCFLVMFVLGPEFRAILRMYNYHYELRETRGGPKIWLPGAR